MADFLTGLETFDSNQPASTLPEGQAAATVPAAGNRELSLVLEKLLWAGLPTRPLGRPKVSLYERSQFNRWGGQETTPQQYNDHPTQPAGHDDETGNCQALPPSLANRCLKNLSGELRKAFVSL
jgi:hypothetical protein